MGSRIKDALNAVPAVIGGTLGPIVAAKAFEVGQKMVPDPKVMIVVADIAGSPLSVDAQTLKSVTEYGIPATALILGAGAVYSAYRSIRESHREDH